MKENNSPLNNLDVRSKYSREIQELFEKNGLNWWASPSVKTSEIFIHSKNYFQWENISNVSRISLQIKEGRPSFGVSGYFPKRISDIKKMLEEKGYEYHDKGHTDDGRPKGRWWLTKSLENLESLVGELKDIETIILEEHLKPYHEKGDYIFRSILS